jgi:hypothetical protein
MGDDVGVGAGVVMLTSVHAETPPGTPITAAPIRYGAIEMGDGCDMRSEGDWASGLATEPPRRRRARSGAT